MTPGVLVIVDIEINIRFICIGSRCNTLSGDPNVFAGWVPAKIVDHGRIRLKERVPPGWGVRTMEGGERAPLCPTCVQACL